MKKFITILDYFLKMLTTATYTFYLLRVGISFISYVQSQIARGFKKGVWKLSTAETKIIVVLCYYALFGLVSLSYFAVESSNQDDFLLAIQQYFVCEAVGSGNECNLSGFDTYEFHFLTILVYMMLGFVPAVNLIFVINWTAARASCKRFWKKHFPKMADRQANMENNQSKTTDTVETNI